MSSRTHSATPTRLLLLALVPGAVAQTAVFGIGTLLNLSLCALACLATEATCLRARGHAPLQQLRDGSALLTGLLLGFALPVQGSWWLPLLGGVLAIGIGKQLYGPRGQSPFNPAMVGFALLLLCVPHEMTRWLPTIDGVSSATVLDHVRTELHLARTLEEIFGGTRLYERGETWINLAFLFGGLWLLQQRRLPWRIPAGVLAGLALPAVVFWSGDTSLHPSPLFHLFCGSTMLGAFFIATAPPSSPRAGQAQWIYSLGIGAAAYAIRSWGEYPDGFAFAVLLFNAAAPALDRWTMPTADASARSPRWALAAIALALAATTTITFTALQQRRSNALPELADLGFRGAVSTDAEIIHDTALGDFTLYRLQQNGSVVGVLLRTAREGYSGDVDVVTAIHADGRIADVRVLHHRETRGIGDRIDAARDPWVLGFSGKGIDDASIDQLSGATVSTHAVTTAVQGSLEYFTAHQGRLLGSAPPRHDSP